MTDIVDPLLNAQSLLSNKSASKASSQKKKRDAPGVVLFFDELAIPSSAGMSSRSVIDRKNR